MVILTPSLRPATSSPPRLCVEGRHLRGRLKLPFVVLLVLACCPGTLAAQELVWAGDAEGGAPYVFPDPRNPAAIIGYEVDLARALAEKMGRTSRFVQNQWDGLIPGLGRSEYDIVLNGLEITPERRQQIDFSIPYYYSTLTITVREGDMRIAGADTLRGRIVGTLKASFAERYLEGLGDVTIRSYEGQVNPYADLTLGRLDAVVMDTPIALYYSIQNPRMKNTQLPAVRFPLGIGMRKDSGPLLEDINAALRSMMADGTLRRIYADWGIYNAATAQYFQEDLPAGPPTRYVEYLEAVTRERTTGERLLQYRAYLPLLLRGAAVTLGISAAAMALAIMLGIALAVLRLYAPAIIRWGVVAHIEIVRGTPLLIQLFIIYYGLPSAGIQLSPFWAAVAGLGMNYGAYEAENYRAGIQAIPRGQMDAAIALGFSRAQAVRRIILPQAVRLVIPPVTNDFIALLKDSSLVSVITMVELTKMYGQLAATYYDYIGIGLMTAAIYFLLGLPIARFSRMMEERLAYMRT